MITITDGQTDVILDDIQEDEFWHDNHHKSLKDNVETFDFVTFANRGFSEYLAKRNRIIIPDEDGKYIEFIIHNTRKYRSPQGGLFIEVYTMASYTELATSKVIRPQKTPSWTPKQHVEFALAGTGYEVGQVDHGGFRTLTIEQHTNPFAYLKRVASVYDFELHFRIEENGNRVTRRYVDLIKRVGNWQGREVEFGKDLLGIERKEDTSKIVTALIGLGPEREDGTRLELLVEDKEALARWGRNGQHIIDIYEPESTDTEMTEERLRTLTENELKKRVNSVVEYTADIADLEKVSGLEHEKIRFGDVIRIKDIDFNPPLYLEARIHTMERSIKKNGYKTVTLGDYIEYTEEEVMAIWKSLKAELAKKVSMSDVTEVVYTKPEVDSAIANIRVGGRNLVIRHNELKNKWIDTTGDISDWPSHAVMEDYISVTPNEVLTFTKTDSELASDGGFWRWRWFDAEKNYIARKADDRNEFQWIVPENTYFIQVSYPMDAFPKIERGNKATDWTPAPEDVQSEIDNVYEYASSEIQQLAGEVSTKAEQSTVTALGNRVTTAENNISALQGEITQKVSQSTFNALENRVTQAESTITQTADDVTFAFERIDSIDGVLNSAVTTIDASGVTVKDGSFYLEDDTSDTKYSIVPKTNLLSDHSFEMVERTGSVDLTYGDFAVKPQIDSFGEWRTVGSPRLLSAYQTDWVEFSLFYFGLQAIVVSSTDYVEQHFPYIPGKTYTVSAYFTGSTRSTSGVPRIDVRLEQGVTEEVKKTWTRSFSSVTFGQKLTRCSLTFTVPADADNSLGGDIVMVSIRADSGWVVADGVQVVEGETPTLYDPENAVWDLLYGRYEGRGFTGDYTIVDYGSNENGNFVRFGQGLQICWFQTEINMAINNQYGVLYQNSMKWTYPATFSVTPNVCVGEARWSTGASWGTPTTTERLSTDIRVIDVALRNAGRTRIKAIAIGRWK